MWTANPNQFVEDEDDDTFSFSVRIAAQDVLLVSEQNSVTHKELTSEAIPILTQWPSGYCSR